MVEDDPGVRELTVSRLKAIGYKVVEAVDGREGDRGCWKSPEPVDLVFTDLVMPGGISGRDVAALARKLRPGIKILLDVGIRPKTWCQSIPNLLSSKSCESPTGKGTS